MSEVKAPTATAVTNALREKEFNALKGLLAANGYEVLQTKGAQIACPVVDSLNGERFIRITVEVPEGSRDGVAYDGYAEAQEYADDQAEKAAKAKAAAEAKAKKEAAKESKS